MGMTQDKKCEEEKKKKKEKKRGITNSCDVINVAWLL